MDAATAKAADDVDATGAVGGGVNAASFPSMSNSSNNAAVSSPQFPQKLHRMLDAATDGGFEDIVRWELDGRAFKVYKVQEFVDRVLPMYFNKQSKYKSFQRQLNLYGFQRIGADGPVKKGYRHPNFIRGRLDLCPMVTREAGVGGGGGDFGDEGERHMVDTPSSPLPRSSKAKTSASSPTKPLKVKSKAKPTTPKSTRNGKTTSQQSPPPPPPQVYQNVAAASSALRSGHNSHNLSELQFPYKLYEMLETVERENLTHIVSWSPSGTDGFKVHDVDAFSAQIMGRFFKQQSKYRR